MNYIHYNPVKHGLVQAVGEWPWSTYHRSCQERIYSDKDWASIQEQMGGLSVGE